MVAERELHCTLIPTVISTGDSLPPTVVFPHSLASVELERAVKLIHPKANLAYSEDGRSNMAIYRKHTKRQVENWKEYQEQNGGWVDSETKIKASGHHSTHKHIATLEILQANNIDTVFPLSHSTTTTASEAPANGSFALLDKYVADELKHLRGARREPTITEKFAAVGRAYNRAFTKENILKWWRMTGLNPLNRAAIRKKLEQGKATRTGFEGPNASLINCHPHPGDELLEMEIERAKKRILEERHGGIMPTDHKLARLVNLEAELTALREERERFRTVQSIHPEHLPPLPALHQPLQRLG
eukprot:comp14101_c0_seq1/m.9980 comp14101_c0_seq1/g.9980  ORF comp14101_c0_seq1/g.9980 comp14101_c0_seq1/m.9980 type:complete len:302 (-) comp14101_c0_seq1:542-1447(-)